MTQENFISVSFLIGEDRHQYWGIMTQIRKNYAMGEKTYPEKVKKSQALLMAWEGEKAPTRGSNKGLSFSNFMNNNGGDGDAAGNGGAQESGGRATCGSAPETRRYYHCKKGGHMKPDCLNLKAKRASEEAKNVASGGADKAYNTKYSTYNHSHMILFDKFEYFNTRAKDHFFLLQVVGNFINILASWLFLNIESTIDIIANKSIVTNIKKSDSPITLH